MEVIEYAKDFYILDTGRVRAFLIIGAMRAILIDTCFQEDHIIDEVKKLTNKRIDVVLTHGDFDHLGGLADFQKCYVHVKDSQMIHCDIAISYLKSRDEISVGDYCFEVIEIPGHSYGSIALLDRKKKLLLSGDTVQKGPIFMFGNHRNLDLYIDSLQKLKRISDIEVILPSHHVYPIGREYIDYCVEDALALKNNELEGIPHNHMPCSHYKGKHIEFYY